MTELGSLMTKFANLAQRDDLNRVDSFHEARSLVHAMCGDFVAREKAGQSRDQILSLIEPVRELHATSPFVRRLQEWPRGYPGDFETVRYIMNGENQATPGTIGFICEDFALNSAIAQQHRNKVRHQASRILETCLSSDFVQVFSMASGGSPDVESILPTLKRLGGDIEFYFNDSDPFALATAREALAPIGNSCHFIPGNSLTVVRRIRAVGRFNLVMAGALFDYLNDDQVTYLIRHAYHGLLKPYGRLFFTNIASPNPYRPLIEYLGDWFLVERNEDDIRRLCRAADVAADRVSIRRDETGLALLVDVTR
ncbi:MAG TPA: class I SAM-dependent methyltransferase [Thermoanaerobaculia bacterium]|nr:class I SAM-dependent methyltransferase [Thermoanaerobaculia bacterium]